MASFSATPTLGDRRLTARAGAALVVANIRYWSTVAPLAGAQLRRWERRAAAIPDRTLREVALANLREEGFNAQTGATLATLAPREYRKPVVEAIVGSQVIYDYLDSLLERPLADPLGDGNRMLRALTEAIVLGAEPAGDYYAGGFAAGDGGYLDELVGVVRGALARLPRTAEVAEVAERVVTRCAQAQVRAHAVRAHAAPALGRAQLEEWASAGAAGTGLGWREFLAGAASSGLALHALIAAAADPSTTCASARAIDVVYLPLSAVPTLMDGLVDHAQDLDSGRLGYIDYYESREALAGGLKSVVRQAARGARDAPNTAYHVMTLAGAVAYYLSAPTAYSEFARPVTEPLREELRPLITQTLAVMHAWRAAKRLRAAIPTARAA